MKKIFLFVSVAALTLSLGSCSNDDDNGSSKSVSFKVDGVSKSFKVESEVVGGSVFVFGYKGPIDNPTESVQFTVESNATGSNAVDNFSYSNSTDDYDDSFPSTLTSEVTTNTGGKLKGTFSGTLEGFDTDATVTITEGKFSTSF